MNIAQARCIALLAIPLLAGCASQPIVLSRVGPAAGRSETHASRGYLQVYSATETHEEGNNTFYYPHKGYCILSDAGKMVRYVGNHVGVMDESPSLVTVRAGKYQIVADADGYGRVTVPIEIRGGQRTILHLERDWKPTSGIAENLVRLPGGEAVGWSATTN